jgi:5-(hydroxymethyl)furfural/furfural oxidase
MDYDYVIVSAVLAARLSVSPGVHVALIEAGPDDGSAQTPAAMKLANPNEIIVVEPYADYHRDTLQSRRTRVQAPHTYCRGRGMGGSSANGQIAIRAVPEDFDDWATGACAGWSYADVRPAFWRLESYAHFGAEPYHGANGPIPI